VKGTLSLSRLGPKVPCDPAAAIVCTSAVGDEQALARDPRSPGGHSWGSRPSASGTAIVSNARHKNPTIHSVNLTALITPERYPAQRGSGTVETTYRQVTCLKPSSGFPVGASVAQQPWKPWCLAHPEPVREGHACRRLRQRLVVLMTNF